MWNPFKKKVVESPAQSELDFFASMYPYTTDMSIVTTRPFHLLFLYDRLQSDQADFDFFGGEAMCLGSVFTLDKFALIKRDIGVESYPIPLDTAPFSKPELSIRGELVLCPTEKLIELDTERKNGVKFERRMITVQLPFRRRSGSRLMPDLLFHNLRCWMYVGVKDFWEPLADDHKNFHMFDMVSDITPNNPLLKKYYYFTKNEYISD